ncbi:Serine/threonine protein kinase/TGF-beta stimulated factor [Tribonema minus]|uniref:Serine/threonine protein kinase/TGF-beta stimulated factor n=1 Tax=Tribonema minus TaxID=303371 RepID=A0A835Z4K9_9STRA|nr:Serine/threonine protein kinase/TGF-beta stimulated factor [Tribonema minus]
MPLTAVDTAYDLLCRMWASLWWLLGAVWGALGFTSQNWITLTAGGTRVAVDAEPLAEGGCSFVYMARDAVSGKEYALKKVLCQTMEQKDLAEAEIRRHRAFNHPNLMPILDWGFREAGSLGSAAYMLFPYMAGGTLRDLINRRTLTGLISEQEVLVIFQGVCRGVHELHSARPPLAHRDIKADNVMLQLDGTPVLMDFGSMVPADRGKNRSEALLVQDEAAQYCTVSYRAPELFDVASSAVIDARTDVWSLGCLLYALAFGYSPFECEFTSFDQPRVVECSFLRVIGPITWPKKPRFSSGLCDLIKWILNQDPQQRPQVDGVLVKTDELLQQCRSTPSLIADSV